MENYSHAYNQCGNQISKKTECKIIKFPTLNNNIELDGRLHTGGATIGGANAIQDTNVIRDILDYFFNHKNQKNYKSFGIRNCALMTFGFNTNLRGGDVLKLRLRDVINPYTGKIVDRFIIREQKTKKVKEVELNEEVQDSLLLYLETERQDFLYNLDQPLFCSRQKNSRTLKESEELKPITIQRYNQLLKEVKDKLQIEIDKLSTHSCRKSWARNVYNMSPDDKKQYALSVISSALNHNNVETTMIYLDIRRDELREISKSYSIGRTK